MISGEHSELFKKDNAKKDLILNFGDFQITNSNLYSEAFELQESLCSQNELRFGCCEASVLKFKCRNEFGELKNKWFEASMVLNDNTDNPFKIGLYRVFDSKPSGDKLYTNVTAYDPMYDIINAEMVEWYDSLPFPVPMFYFRNKFFEYFGIEQEEEQLVNDTMLIDKTIDADSISGKQIITAICEINGVFGHINRNGKFQYVSLTKRKQIIYPGLSIVYPGNGIYPGYYLDQKSGMLLPSENLYPRENLYPSDDSGYSYPYESVGTSRYKTCEYEDFETQIISKLQIRQEENDIGIVLGSGENTYIVQDNFLVYEKSFDDLKPIANNLLSKIGGICYRPFKASLQSNPCIEVGDVVVFHTKYKEVESYVLERSIKGIQSLKDSFESKGVYEYSEKVNSVNKEVKRLKGKTAVLERTVEMLNSEMNDEETGLKSQIKQTADKIELKVSKDEVVSEINQSPEEVKIKSEKISLEGTVTANENFKVLKDGSIQAKNGTFEGTINTNSANITGGTIQINTSGEYDTIALFYDGEYYIRLSAFGLDVNHGYNSVSIRSGSISLRDLSSESNNPPGFVSSVTRFTVNSDFAVGSGYTKSRIAETKSYNERLLYCYEMPSPIFGDVGHGIIGEDGLCYVDIDQVFFETVDMNQSYQVFLQSYAENNIYVVEKQSQYFVVKGLPNTEFDWELKAKQLDFPTHRLEENFAEDNYQEKDYIVLADKYLSEYEQEVLNYE